MMRYIAVLFMLLSSTVVHAAPVDVALANASFELGTDAPDNWTPFEEAENYVWDTGEVSAGEHSLSIHGTRWFYGRWSSDAIAVEAGGYQWYTLSGQVKTQGNNGEVYLALAWYDTDGALINTSDSPMLSEGSNDWATVTVSALPPAGATTLSVWCISNHNAGRTWFDGVALKRTHFAAAGAASYDQFLIDHPTDALAIEAIMMRVQERITSAKWTREADFYNTDGLLDASVLYGEAAEMPRKDAVIAKVLAALHQRPAERLKAGAAIRERFKGLRIRALRAALETAGAGGNTERAEKFRTTLSTLLDQAAD